MKPVISFIFLAICLIAVIVLAIIGDIPTWSFFIPGGLGLVALIMILSGILMPARMVSRGMELIKAQDYNNRLVKVGEPNADRIVSLFNSLIDKLRAERLMNREHESLLKLVIEASPMGVVMLDFNKKVSLVNDSFYKICSLQTSMDIIGKPFKDILCDLIPEMLKVPLGKSEIIRKGNYRIYRCYHLNFIKEGFKHEFYLLESLTEEIMKAERSSYEKVIRTISHEVNNTMGGVKSVLELMSENSEDPEISRVIRSCENRCERMCGFIRDYAEVVKLPDPVLKKLNLSQEIELMIPFLKQMLPERISLYYSMEEEENLICGDSTQIQQVVLNVVKNAMESIPEKGEIRIEIRKEKEGILLQVSNNGASIPEDVASQLFTPFFTTKPDGKGIGLTFVREVLNRHKADFSLFTDKDNITRFNIFFKYLL